MSTLDLILKELKAINSPPTPMQRNWVKLSKWCKEKSISQTFAIDCFAECISRPKGRIYMIDTIPKRNRRDL